MATFNANWNPLSYGRNLSTGGDGGYDPSAFDWTPAFSGLPQGTTARRNADGTFVLSQNVDSRRDRRATVKVDPKTGRVPDAVWRNFDGGSIGKTLGEFGLLAGGAFAGLGALGAGPLAGMFGAGAGGAAAGEAAIPNALGFGLEGTAGYVVPETTGALGFGMGGTAGYTIPTASGLTPTAGGGLGLVDKVVDAIKKNPKPIVQVAGGLLGGASGGSGGSGGGSDYNGPMPTITRGGFLPSIEAKTMPFADVSQPMPKKKGQQTSGLWRFLE